MAAGADASEAALIEAIAGMLARPDFMLPLAAAERQFRDHYYGLNSAALLEDLFFDALGNYVRQTLPTSSLSRPAAGHKGWDYAFNGLRVSHKVSQKLDVVAALWDATRTDVTRWSFDDPIVYVLGSNSPRTAIQVELPGGGVPVPCRALVDLPRPERLGARTALAVSWPAGSGSPTVLATWTGTSADHVVVDEVPFARVWERIAEHLAAGRPANELEILVTNRPLAPLDAAALAALPAEAPADVAVPYRAGVYVLPRAMLQDLEVRTNNRAILIPRPTIERLLRAARDVGWFVPFSQWYAAYSENRPPDLYSAQRGEYDSLFSARGRDLL